MDLMTYEEFRKKHPATRCWQKYTTEQRSNHLASHRLGHRQREALGTYYYTHPMLPNICCETAKDATKQAYARYVERARVGEVADWLAAQ